MSISGIIWKRGKHMPTYNPRQQVELFHLLFLSQLGRKIDKNLFALKGGCNMRFYFNSIRYSEDMGIDIQTMQKDTLRKNIDRIFDSTPFNSILKSYGLEIQTVSAPKQTETTQRWKISLISSISALPLQTKIEFSRRKLGGEVSFEIINQQLLQQYSLQPIISNHYTMQSMYQQKILALALRSQVQSRDIFDLYLLINAGASQQTILNAETINHLITARSNAESISFTDFKGQVLAYLPQDYQLQYNNESLWKNIVDCVVMALGKSK